MEMKENYKISDETIDLLMDKFDMVSLLGG